MDKYDSIADCRVHWMSNKFKRMSQGVRDVTQCGGSPVKLRP